MPSSWKERAERIFPEIDLDEEEIDNPLRMWMEVEYLIQDKVYQGDEKFISKALAEMIYYLESEQTSDLAEFDDYTAIVHGFAKNVVGIKGIEPHILKHIPKSIFEDFKNVFIYASEKKYWKILNSYKNKP